MTGPEGKGWPLACAVSRNGVLTARQCGEVWSAADRLLLAIERPVDMAAALALALDKSISAYDAQYNLSRSFSRLTMPQRGSPAVEGVSANCDIPEGFLFGARRRAISNSRGFHHSVFFHKSAGAVALLRLAKARVAQVLLAVYRFVFLGEN